MKNIDLGMKSKRSAPTDNDPDASIEVTHHPEMSFVAPHHLNLPKGKFHFQGHAELVAHDARESGGAVEGNPRYTLKVHSLDLPHNESSNNEDVNQAISGMMDKLHKGKNAETVTPSDAGH